MVFADLNGDQFVDFGDVLLVLTRWGTCGSACCVEDLNFDGAIDFSDVLIVFQNWMPRG